MRARPDLIQMRMAREKSVVVRTINLFWAIKCMELLKHYVCLPETNIALYVNYALIINKKITKKMRNRNLVVVGRGKWVSR